MLYALRYGHSQRNNMPLQNIKTADWMLRPVYNDHADAGVSPVVSHEILDEILQCFKCQPATDHQVTKHIQFVIAQLSTQKRSNQICYRNIGLYRWTLV